MFANICHGGSANVYAARRRSDGVPVGELEMIDQYWGGGGGVGGGGGGGGGGEGVGGIEERIF